jgi:predicted TIM-barrel fold metal-dependent hydrolase
MRECPNIYVETSNFVGNGYIEYTVREFGAGRLIFGSFLPVNDPSVAICMVLDADIDEKEKKLIASENLSRLVDGVLP